MPAPGAGGWCKIKRALEWKVVKEVKETEQSVVKHNVSFLTLFEEGP